MPPPSHSKEAVMFVGTVNNWAVNQSERVILAMNTSAQWEVWLQVELAVFLKQQCGAAVLREVKYDGSQQSVDLVVRMNDRAIAVELKTESLKTGNVSGTTMVKALLSDMEKLASNELLKQFATLGCTKWSSIVIGIGHGSKYVGTAKKILNVNTTGVKWKEDFGIYISLVAEGV